MYLDVFQRLFAFSRSIGSTRSRVMAGALVVAVVAVACGSDSSPNVIRGVPFEERSTATSGADEPVVAGRADDAAPSFTVETFSHGTYNLAENAGRPVLINFWFPSCPPCRAEMADLQASFEKYGDEVDFVGVQQTSVDTAQDGIDFLEEIGVTYPNFADETEDTVGDVQIAYRVLSYPTTIFLNRDHTINRTWTGLITESKLEEQIEAVINS